MEDSPDLVRRDAEEIVIRMDEVYEGALRATGVLRIEGKVRGTIDAKGDVIIGENTARLGRRLRGQPDRRR